MPASSSHIFGVRHHGPGSARSLVNALAACAPDCLLIEGPPDAAEVLALAANEEMKPPIALLVHDAEKPQRAVYYPLAVFSPEWQAIQYALSRRVPVRFMDLPQSIQMGIEVKKEAKASADANRDTNAVREKEAKESRLGAEPPASTDCHEILKAYASDPISYLARAAGYDDSERWWEHMVEHRRDGQDIFAAILEAMTALRESGLPSSLQSLDTEREARREAWMRQTMRTAQKEGFQRIAVVCGAWHAPALARMPAAKEDAALLKGLPKRKVTTTWIPWTYSRLALSSGYGAGIESPGWYDFLWEFSARDFPRQAVSETAVNPLSLPSPAARDTTLAVAWLTHVARLLRGEDLDASSASVIEAVRLAESLAALRGRPLPGLPELNEATQTVFCLGDYLPLQVISQKLIVSERLGAVPASTPMVPLAQDVAREQKRLRLPPEAAQRVLDLDLRKPTDLDRSQLLHRLNLLGVSWGDAKRGSNRQQGTFHEVWQLQWQPEFAVSLIEAGVWGNTILSAAAARARNDADQAPDLPTLTALLDATLLADLPEAAAHIMARLQAEAAVASDVGHLMAALPPLVNILRYGNVRQTDAAMVSGVVDGLVARICIGLPGACGSLNDEAAAVMFEHLLATHSALTLLQNPTHLEAWNIVLRALADSSGLNNLIAGRACRLLLDIRQFDPLEAARRFSLALSTANQPAQAAAWIEGFLRGSGLLLLHDTALWPVLDEWISTLTPDHFTAVAPLLRRTFATFAAAERRQMGERVSRGRARSLPASGRVGELNENRAMAALPLIAQLLGLKT